MELLSGLLLGFLGSFHCIGMCGPLVLALPHSSRFMLRRIIHNLGRVITYALFGLILGFLGSRIFLAGLQQVISIILGGLIIIVVVLPFSFKTAFLKAAGLDKLILYLKISLSKLYKSNSIPAFFVIGLLNGFLPCGFVYIALTGALAIGDSVNSSVFMLMFGLGTIPAMIAISIAGKLITINFRDKLKKLIPAFSIAIAFLFILRGLNLGIPYLSPKIDQQKNSSEEVICH
ncbi:MAG TPA: sulfite exporter TauE/SafE family protein [Ignavibacteria bacterium]|jgi:hypothetical protein